MKGRAYTLMRKRQKKGERTETYKDRYRYRFISYISVSISIYQLVVRRLTLLRTEKRSDLENKKITSTWRFQRLPLEKRYLNAVLKMVKSEFIEVTL